jgi:predicted acylesterase/phospholipase RssA
MSSHRRTRSAEDATLRRAQKPTPAKPPSAMKRAVSLLFYSFVMYPMIALRNVVVRYTGKVQRRRQEARFRSVFDATEDQGTWRAAAAALDKLHGFGAWKRTPVACTSYCNQPGLENETVLIASLLRAGNERAMGTYIRTCLHRNLHGVNEAPLFRYYCGTKTFVERYTDAVVTMISTFGRSRCATPSSDGAPSTMRSDKSDVARELSSFFDDVDGGDLAPDTATHHLTLLDYACREGDAPASRLTVSERYHMLRDTAQSFGRSALLLSGGASLGMFHIGVVRALWVAQLLPKIMSGSSAGAIIASLFCTKTDAELDEMVLDNDSYFANVSLKYFETSEEHEVEENLSGKVDRLIATGAFMDIEVLIEGLRANCGDLTFLEAYRLTGRILNVSVSRDTRSMLVNYITAPNVIIWSAVAASCAWPGLFTPVQLLQKAADGTGSPYLEGQLWCDGSVTCDLPKTRLAELFNVNYFIVSQTNPQVVPFLPPPPSSLLYRSYRWVDFFKGLWFGCGGEVKHWWLKLYRFGLLKHDTEASQLPYLLLTQTYHGDVTIQPIGSLLQAVPDFINLTTNPTREHLEYVVCGGQRETWPHLNHIHYATKVERALERTLNELRAELKTETHWGPAEDANRC